MRLNQLQPGDTFRVRATGQLGVLMLVNECRARVRVKGETIRKGFEAKGKWVEFNAPSGGYDNWAPSVEVDLIEKVEEPNESSTLEEAGIL